MALTMSPKHDLDAQSFAANNLRETHLIQPPVPGGQLIVSSNIGDCPLGLLANGPWTQTM